MLMSTEDCKTESLFHRLRHVHLHQEVQLLPEREGRVLPTGGCGFHQDEERVRGPKLTSHLEGHKKKKKTFQKCPFEGGTLQLQGQTRKCDANAAAG